MRSLTAIEGKPFAAKNFPQSPKRIQSTITVPDRKPIRITRITYIQECKTNKKDKKKIVLYRNKQIDTSHM